MTVKLELRSASFVDDTNSVFTLDYKGAGGTVSDRSSAEAGASKYHDISYRVPAAGPPIRAATDDSPAKAGSGSRRFLVFLTIVLIAGLFPWVYMRAKGQKQGS